MIDEKRQFLRQSLSGQVHIDIVKASNKDINTRVRYEGLMKDFSYSGIRLHGKHPLEANAKLDLLVEFESDHSKYSLSGNVKWVTQTTENEFIAGLELSESTSNDLHKWREKFS